MTTAEKSSLGDIHGLPPPYPSNSSSFPPTYQFPLNIPSTADIPPTFQVGSDTTFPLISGSAVLAHLRLLGAFHALELSVSIPQSKSDDASDPPGAVRWRVFLHQAVWRFEIWLKRVVKPRGTQNRGLRDEEIPPLDVLLVWHAYLLNPRVYSEDTTRVHRKLGALGGLPLERIATQIDPTTLKFNPTPAQAESWEAKTLAPREPLSLSLSSRDELAVECPRCGGPPVQVAWLREPHLTNGGEAQGTGWCQNQFKARCGSCQFNITRESIAVGHFAADIATALTNKDAFLPGTLYSPLTCSPSHEQAQRITALLLQPFVDLPPVQQAIGERIGWSFSGIEANVTDARDILLGVVRARDPRFKMKPPERTGLPTHGGTDELCARIITAQSQIGTDVKRTWRSFGPRIAKMLASYRDNPTPFSLDLVGAILRQTSFTSKISALGWLDPLNPNPPLTQSITRYHNFLHLLSRYKGSFMVPTLDIDLGWHTHQLAGAVYMSDTLRCVGRYVDHDDKVEEGVLSDAFDNTSRLWEKTFQTPYSSCEPTLGPYVPPFSKLKKKLSKRLSKTPEEADSPLDPTTFPSEHPSIVVVQDNRIADSRSRRERKRSKRKPLGTAEEPFLKRVNGPAGSVPAPVGGAVAFGAMGLAGWALLGDVDQSVLDAKTVEKGQCCAGYGMPFFAGPVWMGGINSGGCATGGCTAGACGGVGGGCGGGAGGACGGGGGACGGGGGGCGGGGGGGCGGGGS